MPTYGVELMARSRRQFRSLEAPVRRRVEAALRSLAVDPRPPGAVALQGRKETYLRIRVGDHRVIYLVEDGRLVVLVVEVGHRREVYR